MRFHKINLFILLTLILGVGAGSVIPSPARADEITSPMIEIVPLEAEAGVLFQMGNCFCLRLAVEVRRAEVTRRVSAGDRLDLDHVRPHVGKHPPTNRAGHDVREFDDMKSDEWTTSL